MSWELDILGYDSTNNVVPHSGREDESFDLFFDLTSAIRNISPTDLQALKSVVGSTLLKNNPDIYKRDAFDNQNISNFKTYIKAAVAKGVIKEGGDLGHAWVKIVSVNTIQNPSSWP